MKFSQLFESNIEQEVVVLTHSKLLVLAALQCTNYKILYSIELEPKSADIWHEKKILSV